MRNKVLVVDDSVTFQTIISVTLKQSSKDVIIAGDGFEALECLKDTSFDLFIVDINMPRMGGVEFITEMKKQARFANTPIVILAASDEADAYPQLMSVGPLHWLEKGFTPTELISKVDSIFS